VKRLLVFVLVVIASTNPVRAIDPIGATSGNSIPQCPAYPILPSKSAILGGTVFNQFKNTPYFLPSADLTSGQVCLDLNSRRFSPEYSTFFLRSNPGWDSGETQTISLIQNNIDGSKFLVGNRTEAFPASGITISIKLANDRWQYFIYGQDLKPMFKLSCDQNSHLYLYPISKKYFFCSGNPDTRILDAVGNRIVSGEQIIVPEDPFKRYVFVDRKLFDLDKRAFVELPVEKLPDIQFFRFLPDYVEIVNLCDISPPIPDCRPHVWRVNYKWELVEEFDVEFPFESSYFNCYEIFNGLMVSFNRTGNDERCGWYFYDYRQKKTLLFLPCNGFRDLAAKYIRKGNVMLIPNPDGGWIVDLGKLSTSNLIFPQKTSIIKTDNGLFAVDRKAGDGMVSGCYLDDNLKPIESMRTNLADAQNYLSHKNKIISLEHEDIPIYDKIKKINIFEIRLTVWCSLQGDTKPKKVGYYKFKSRYPITGNMCCNVFKDRLYIPTDVADWFSIDLITYRTQTFINDQLFFQYGSRMYNKPEFMATEMLMAFIHENKRLFVFDNWKNLKIDAPIEQDYWNEQRVWVWWDKVIVAGETKTTIFKLDGTRQEMDGKAVSFSNGWLQILENQDSSGSQNLIGLDVDTQYKKLIWSKVGDSKKLKSYDPVGYDYQIGSNLFDREGNLVQTGITDLSTIKVDSGSAFMTCGINGIKSCGSDYFITKWTPAPQYAINRTYKNEFEITATRGDGKNDSLLSGTFFACRWGDYGMPPNLAKLDEVLKINNLKYGETMRFRVRIPANSALVDDANEIKCFALVFIGNGLLDVGQSNLANHDQKNRARFDGTPIDALNQVAVSLTVWDEQP